MLKHTTNGGNAGTALSNRRRFCTSLALGLAAFLPWLAGAQTVSSNQVVRVACVGDSITFGAGLKDRKTEAYPIVLSGLLGTGWDVRNFGHSGATLLKKGNLPYFKQKEHDKALAFKPDIVVILLGTNDSKHRGEGSLDSSDAIDNWQFKADFIPDYEALIAEFRAVNPDVKIYVALPTPCFPGRWGINGGTIQDEIIPMIRQVAKDKNTGIIDLHSALTGKAEFFPDTIHPNAGGAKLMAEAVHEALAAK